jgi:hypothetical protein
MAGLFHGARSSTALNPPASLPEFFTMLEDVVEG